ncbi:DUF192 domain-containing protein [Halorubellus sp. JP-L1]|uniref:DUF192 domain-containing protein n=1 Tax=Halorubellus sp. JP-L1 TaxID=2715753 RepID=UPI00140AF3F4|nr:DUF192 domain-containing protein [Halorubellus sp. JP-L1]
MDRERWWQLAVLGVIVVLVALVLFQSGAFAVPWATDRDAGAVTVSDAESGASTCVAVEVADTRPERFTGLSEHDSLANGSGMWFVHDSEENVTYVMREMSFPIDIVFVSADGRVTSVASLRAPEAGEDGESIRASGRAKWVLEVPRGYAAANGIDEGDRVDVTYGTTECTA